MLTAHCHRYHLSAVPQSIMTRPPSTVPFCIRKEVCTLNWNLNHRLDWPLHMRQKILVAMEVTRLLHVKRKVVPHLTMYEHYPGQ